MTMEDKTAEEEASPPLGVPDAAHDMGDQEESFELGEETTENEHLSLQSLAAADDADNQSTLHTLQEPPQAEENAEQHESDSSDDEEDEGIGGSLPETVGGSITKSSFCLLDGVFLEDQEYHAAQVPITCLPATLGRHHMTDDDTFISMGKLRVLSRQMLRINYRTKDGILLHEKGKFSFVKDKTEAEFVDSLPSSADETFFSLTSLGKNSILVNGKRLNQGQSIRLSSGDAIKVSCYLLYFLLPTQSPTQTMQFGGTSSPKKKPVVSKKRPVPTTVVSTAIPTMANKKKKTTNATATQGATTIAGASGHVGGWAGLQADLDVTSTAELMQQFVQAIDDGVWDRKSQMIGHTLAHRALMACAADPQMQRENDEMGGVIRNDIMKWIDESDEYCLWSKKVQTKVENKTFVANFTKALGKAGYERTTNAGRYIRWKLPGTVAMQAVDSNAEPKEDVKKSESSAREEGDDDGDDAGSMDEAPSEMGDGHDATEKADDSLSVAGSDAED